MPIRFCAALAALLAAAALAGCGTSSSAPKNANIPVNVVNGKPQGGVRTYKVKKGGQIRLTVKSDTTDEVHVHGYNVKKDVAKGGTVTFDFPAVSAAVITAGLAAAFAVPAGAKSSTVKVEINDDGCPAKLTIKAGPTHFKVRNTGSGVNVDYHIDELADLLGRGDAEISRLVWDAVATVGAKAMTASYSPNQSRTANQRPSSLAYTVSYLASSEATGSSVPDSTWKMR